MRFPGSDSVKKENKRKHFISKLNNFAKYKRLIKRLIKRNVKNLKCTCLKFDERNDAKSAESCKQGIYSAYLGLRMQRNCSKLILIS